MSKLIVNVLKDLYSVKLRRNLTKYLNHSEPKSLNLEMSKKGLLAYCWTSVLLSAGPFWVRSNPDGRKFYRIMFVFSSLMRWEILAGANESPGFSTQ